MMPVRKAGRGVAKEGPFFVQRMGSTSQIDAGVEDLAVVTPQAWKAITTANNPPTLFRHGTIAHVEEDDSGAPVIKAINYERMQHVLRGQSAGSAPKKSARRKCRLTATRRSK